MLYNMLILTNTLYSERTPQKSIIEVVIKVQLLSTKVENVLRHIITCEFDVS